ncbi:MAG TPA: fumarylacetoacetate hydrolase family protein [Candidatus Binataceae bacterium]|nr:fumarylacetoacetate hydrolase family protein [Candidatus Binataceae bacterium]
MNVLEGPREELRRIMFEGQPRWVRPDGAGRLLLPEGRQIPESEAVYMAPCDPSKILCIHLNYESRRLEFRAPKLETPTYFQKPTTALNSHHGTLCRPAGHSYLNYEGEVAVIIGRPMRNVGRDEVWDYIAGFAPGNDVGCQDYRDTDAGSMLRVKGMDGFCPVGPGIVRGVDIRQSTLRTFIDGKVVQEAPVSEMVFPIDYQLADLSRFITLLPGDILMSGTPCNSRPMNIGDIVEVEVTGVGRLSNRVIEAPAPAHHVGHQRTDSDSVRRVALGSDWVRPEAR